MTDKPISLEAVRSAPIPELVECLEELLAQAKSGALRSIVYLVFEQDGTVRSGNVGVQENRTYVLGAFQQAAFDYYIQRRKGDGLT